MPFSVACPVCSVDGAGAANEVIALSLSEEMSAHHGGQEILLLLAAIGCLVAGIVGVIKASLMAGGVDVLMRLWASVLASGLATGVYFWEQATRLPKQQNKNASVSIPCAPMGHGFRVAGWFPDKWIARIVEIGCLFILQLPWQDDPALARKAR